MPDLLNNKEIQQFIQDGFIRIDNAFSEETATKARQILWNDLPPESMLTQVFQGRIRQTTLNGA